MSEENVNNANVASANEENLQNTMPVSFEAMINQGSLTPEQALALQLQSMQGLPGMLPMLNPANFPRPTVKRRKPVKWELWEEKNLIEGVRRFGRGNWAQIRAAFEFQGCRTNVDLHDKWRVLTGERKRNRIAQRTDGNVLEGLTDAQKMQLVHGPNGIYSLQSSLLAGGLPQFLEGQQFSAEFLQSLQQGEMLNAAHGDLTVQENLDLQQQHQEEAKAAEAEAAATTTTTITTAATTEQPRKRQKKQKKVAEESEVAKGLLKLSSDKKEEEEGAASTNEEKEGENAATAAAADTSAAEDAAKESASEEPAAKKVKGAKGGKASSKK